MQRRHRRRKARQEGEGQKTIEGRSSHLQQGRTRGEAKKRGSCQTFVGRYLQGRKKKIEEERRERGIYMCACSESALAPFLFGKGIGHKLAREPSRTMHIPYWLLSSVLGNRKLLCNGRLYAHVRQSIYGCPCLLLRRCCPGIQQWMSRSFLLFPTRYPGIYLHTPDLVLYTDAILQTVSNTPFPRPWQLSGRHLATPSYCLVNSHQTPYDVSPVLA